MNGLMNPTFLGLPSLIALPRVTLWSSLQVAALWLIGFVLKGR